MNKPELQKHADAMALAIGETLRRLRPGTMTCTYCGVPSASPHSASCAAAPIIAARGAYRLEAEADILPVLE